MQQDQRDSQWTEAQRHVDGTSRDMPTGFRPCPFCHSVIPWESETCPSCGRVLMERMGADHVSAPRRNPPAPRTQRKNEAVVRLARLRAAVHSRIAHICGALRPSASGDAWSTTSRGASWQVFRPASPVARSWWPRSIPAPTDRERTTVLVAAGILVVLFLLALFGVGHGSMLSR
jgi:hypothetical protein